MTARATILYSEFENDSDNNYRNHCLPGHTELKVAC